MDQPWTDCALCFSPNPLLQATHTASPAARMAWKENVVLCCQRRASIRLHSSPCHAAGGSGAGLGLGLARAAALSPPAGAAFARGAGAVLGARGWALVAPSSACSAQNAAQICHRRRVVGMEGVPGGVAKTHA